MEDQINPLIAKFSHVKGVRGRKPKEHKPLIKRKQTDGEGIEIEVDARSAFLIKKAIELHKKRHEELKLFHYANLAVAIWAAFETYHATLFEQLYRERPDLLKSSEQLTIREAIENREALLDYLIERQLESIGHLKLRDVIEYYRKRLGIELTEARCKQLETFYFLRNVVAHKTGLVRPLQKLKASADFYIVGDEIRVSKTFVIRMLTQIEGAAKTIEKQVVLKFYRKASNPSVKGTSRKRAAPYVER